MKTRFFLLAVATLAAACSKSDNSAGGGDMALPPGAFAVGIGPFMIESGNELVECQVMQLPTKVDTDVVRIHTTLAPGSHHMILYRTTETAARGPYTCTSFAGVIDGEAPVFLAESPDSDMVLPTGVAYHFTAGQYVMLEAHYINTTLKPLNAQGRIDLYAGPADTTYQAADIMMCGSVASLDCKIGGGLLPGDSDYSLPVGFYNGTAISLKGKEQNVDLTKLNVFAFTSHEHHRGIDVKIWQSTSSDISNATLLYDNTSWSNPPLTVLPSDKLLEFAPGQGLAWQCSYDTSADTTDICFGESAATEEMCFIWAYYYPSVGRFIAENDCWAN